MNYECEFTDGPFEVIVTTSGKADLVQFVEGRRRIMRDPRYRPTMNVLLDHTRLNLSRVTSDDLARMADTSLIDDGEIGGTGYFMIVTPRALAYGLARMWRSFLSEKLEQQVFIVETVEEAYERLAQEQAVSQSSELGRLP